MAQPQIYTPIAVNSAHTHPVVPIETQELHLILLFPSSPASQPLGNSIGLASKSCPLPVHNSPSPLSPPGLWQQSHKGLSGFHTSISHKVTAVIFLKDESEQVTSCFKLSNRILSLWKKVPTAPHETEALTPSPLTILQPQHLLWAPETYKASSSSSQPQGLCRSFCLCVKALPQITTRSFSSFRTQLKADSRTGFP